ncbi:MAG: rhomboid family intramembrane serine protease [Candidatus Nanopelagicales bacterium]
MTVVGGALITRPYVTYSLIAINVALFGVSFIIGINELAENFGMWPFGIVLYGEWWRLLTAAFLHGGLLHVAFNMYVLFALGPTLERVLGHARFVVLYLVAALGGQVHRQSAPHIAWETPATEIDALRAPWVLLHNDAFSVPPGAQMLAEADHAPIAFRYGRAWGVQFHPEVDESILAQMFTDIDASPDISEPPLAALRSRADDQRTDSLRLFDRFWAEVGS